MTEPLTMADLMELLVAETGLSPDSVTDDPSATFTDCGLDSLAFLQLQAVIQDRHGFEIDEDRPHESFGDVLGLINEGRSQQVGQP